jgi:hypothetical protein
MSRTRRFIVGVTIVGVIGAGLGTGAAAAATTLNATLLGKSEVPKAGNGRGSARLTLDANKGRICFRITLRRVGTAVAGHIHKGGKKSAGPVFVPLFAKPSKHPRGCVSAKKSAIRAIRRHPSRYYVNVHTAKYPAGAARGQLH